MVDSAWAVGSPVGPVAGAYENGANWTPPIVPDGTAFFGFSYMQIVTLSGSNGVGGWTISAVHMFVNGGNLNFNGAGVVGGTGSYLNNSGLVNFNNSSSAGFLAYSNSGIINFNNGSTGGSAYIDSSGRVNFTGDGPLHDHKLTVGSLSGSGIFDLGANELTVGGNNTDTTISGQIVGGKAGQLVKTGYGSLTLSGINSYGGGTVVAEGEVIVEGKIGKVTIDGSATGSGPVLFGNGVLGSTNVKYGGISAGLDYDDPGRLTAGSLTLGLSGSLIVNVENVAAPGSSGYDQIVVHGKVKIDGAFLSAGGGFGYRKEIPHKLTIIDNDGKDKVDGIFGGGLYRGLQEGDAFVSGLQVYSVSYKGGTGNDVVLRSEGPHASGNDDSNIITTKLGLQYTATNKADLITAEDGDDVVKSGGGNDSVFGGWGVDKLDGGKGSDYVSFLGSEVGDRVITLKGSKASTTLLNGQASDSIKNFENAGGGGANDKITGDGKNNVLRGEGGNDTIKGGAGNDALVGGYSNDVLTGGSGADKFVFDDPDGPASADKLKDFRHGEDKLLLDRFDFRSIGATLDAGEFYAKAGAKHAHDGNDRIIYDTKSGKLYYDHDAKGGDPAELIATLTNKAHLDHHDFLMIV